MPQTYGGEGNVIKTIQPETENRVPLVGHIITDEDIGSLQGAKLQPVNLERIVKLLTDPHSANLYDRHLFALKKLVKHYSKGFLMKDLVTIFKILNVCADRLEVHQLYTEPMCEILQICRLPFFKEKTSDETVYQQIAVESLSQLGYLMRVPCREVRHQICQTIVSLYCDKQPAQQLQKHQANSLEYNRSIIESSDVAETLVKSMGLVEDDLETKLYVLDNLQKLSKESKHNCDAILKALGATRLCARLMDYDPSGQLLFRSTDILWNLLENGYQEEVGLQLNNLECISQLRDAFIQQLTQGYSHYDRQLRNDLLVLASLVAKVNINAPFVEAGFVKQLVLFTTFQEVKTHHALVKHLKLMQNHEDFELKKLFINIIVSLSQDSSVIPILSEGRLLLALFSYVKANEKMSIVGDWTSAQFEELQLHAMAALCTLAPLMIDDYMMCQGSTRLLLLLEWCTGKDEFGGYGNSFHGTAGYDNKKAQMRYVLRLIRSMVSTGADAVLNDLVDQGALHQLTGILKGQDPNPATEEAIDVEMQCDMLFILSVLTDGDMHRKELFGQSGVEVAVRFLKTNPKLLNSGMGHHRLMLAAVDCIWCGVVGCFLTEDYFLEKGGVFLLIDMMENCPQNMHNLVLGCLLDLSENPKTIGHVSAWRGAADITAAHLFCNIWRREEAEMGVEREESGAIADASRPLMGALQGSQEVIALPATCPSQAIVDVSENMRAKLYALFCKIGFIDLPGLTTEDHVTLTIIEHYLDFKLGEVWTEVITELQSEGLRPITPDGEALEAISRTVQDRATHVVEVQKELLQAQNQQHLMEEQEFYAEIRENHRQKEKALKDFNDFVARTSNYNLLKAAKDRQDISIDASRIQTNYKSQETFHSTELPTLQTTTFCGRHIDIESTPFELTGGKLSGYYDRGDGLMSQSSGKEPSLEAC